MDYATLRTRLKSLINRSDFTDDLANSFIQMAQDRLERWPQVDPLRYAPRPSFMEKYVSFTVTYDPDHPGSITLPNDFLQIISLHTETGEVERVGMSKFLKYLETAGDPKVFIQAGHSLRMRPYPSDTTTIYMMYYGTAATLSADTDENEWTIAAVDAMLYGAAVYACDHFEDERLDRYEMRFKEALLELQDQAINESLSGSMAVSPAYNYPSDD